MWRENAGWYPHHPRAGLSREATSSLDRRGKPRRCCSGLKISTSPGGNACRVRVVSLNPAMRCPSFCEISDASKLALSVVSGWVLGGMASRSAMQDPAWSRGRPFWGSRFVRRDVLSVWFLILREGAEWCAVSCANASASQWPDASVSQRAFLIISFLHEWREVARARSPCSTITSPITSVLSPRSRVLI